MDRPKLHRRPISIAAQQAADEIADRPTTPQGRIIEKDGAGRQGLLGKKIRERAALTGMLPHEILLTLARGEPINQRILNPETGEVRVLPHYPDVPTMVKAAGMAAPYYAPKLSAVQALTGVSEDELDHLIAGLATEAGIALGTSGETEASEGEASPGGTEPDR